MKRTNESTALAVLEKVKLINRLIAQGDMSIDRKLFTVVLSPDMWLLFREEKWMRGLMQSAWFFIALCHMLEGQKRIAPLAPGSDLPDTDALTPEQQREFDALLLAPRPLRWGVADSEGNLLQSGEWRG